jgi:hypothetical protein
MGKTILEYVEVDYNEAAATQRQTVSPASSEARAPINDNTLLAGKAIGAEQEHSWIDY